MTSCVEYSRYRSVRLLACGVPNLQLNYMLIINLHDIVSELDPNGDIMILMEGILNQPQQNA